MKCTFGSIRQWRSHVKRYFSANVRDDGSPLAFGVPPAREAESAGGMPKVPKAW